MPLSRQRRYWWNDQIRNLRFSLSCVRSWRKSNLASIFFFVPSFAPTLSIFSFSNPIDGSVSPEKKSCQSFFQRFSAIEMFGPRFSSHDLRLLKSRLAVQSSGIRLARVDLINSGWIRMDTTNSGALGKYFWERMEMIIIGQGYSVLLLCLWLEWLDFFYAWIGLD